MMAGTVNIAPELLDQIKNGFNLEFNSDAKIAALYKKIADGSITFVDANEFAIRVGEILSAQYKKYITADVLPDGKIPSDIAQAILSPTLGNNHTLISRVCSDIQKNVYTSIQLGLNPIKPEINKSRVNGLIQKVSSYRQFDEAAWLFGEPIVNFSQSVVDEFIQANTDFQYDSGLDPKIVRTAVGDCCEWCQNLAGVYVYEEVRDTGNNVFRRHERCRCTVDYILGRRKQNVHTKRWSDSTPEQIAARKRL